MAGISDGKTMQPQLSHLAPIEAIFEDARAGRISILVDDEDRENEGDLFIPAKFAGPRSINYMATHGRGLICLAMSKERTDRLQLPLMARGNESRTGTAFTVSIEARTGVTTGISAADRARTIAAAVADDAQPFDIVSPGHVFPLVAREGGVLVRSGHTEAAVDICRLAGGGDAGVICEIMNPDGTMARLPQLIEFAQREGLKIATIADLIAYRRRTERLVKKVAETKVESRFGGDFRAIAYRNLVDDVEHMALVKGDVSGPEPVLVRVHAVNLFDDIIGDRAYSRGGAIHRAMEYIRKAGRGVIVLMRETHRSSPSEVIAERQTTTPGTGSAIRDIGTGAQILSDLGVHNMIILNTSPRSIAGLEGYGLRIVDRITLDSPCDPQCR